jgi:excisionase family DNA binding protein
MKDSTGTNLQALYKVMFTEYPDVVNVQQLCQMLGGASIKSVYRLLRENKIKGYRIGKGYKIPKLSVIQYLIDQQKSSA